MNGGDNTYVNSDGEDQTRSSTTIPKSVNREIHTAIETHTPFNVPVNSSCGTTIRTASRHNATYPILDPIHLKLGGFSGSGTNGSGESLYFIVEAADLSAYTQRICVGKTQVNNGSRVRASCVSYNLITGAITGRGASAMIDRGSIGGSVGRSPTEILRKTLRVGKSNYFDA